MNLFHVLQLEAREEDPGPWKVRLEAAHDDCADMSCGNCDAHMAGLHLHLTYIDVVDWNYVGVCSEGCAMELVALYNYTVTA